MSQYRSSNRGGGGGGRQYRNNKGKERADQSIPYPNKGKQREDQSNPVPDMKNLNLNRSTTATTATTLLANHFPISVGKCNELFKYDLEIEQSEPGSGSASGASRVFSESDPPRPKRERLAWLLIERLQRQMPNIPMATDFNEQIISAQALSKGDIVEEIEYFDEHDTEPDHDPQVFRITLSNPTVLSLTRLLQHLRGQSEISDKQQTIRALNTIFSYGPYRRCFQSRAQNNQVVLPSLTTRNGNTFFGIAEGIVTDPNGHLTDTGQASIIGSKSLELLCIPGFARSVRPVCSQTGHLNLNINTTTSIFHQNAPTVQHLIDTWRGSRGNLTTAPTRQQIQALGRCLRNLRVRTSYLHRGAARQSEIFGRVTGFAQPSQGKTIPEPASCRMLGSGLQNPPTVASYFDQYYGLKFGTGTRVLVVTVGEGNRLITVPATELTVLPGQVNRNTTEKPKAGIRTPQVNRNEVLNLGRRLFVGDGNNPNAPGARQFGLDLGPQLLGVTSTILPTPDVTYRQPVDISRSLKYGTWNLKDKKYVSTLQRKKRWTYLQLLGSEGDRCPKGSLSMFKEELTKVFSSVGMEGIDFVATGKLHELLLGDNDRTKQLEDLFKILKERPSNINCVVVFLPSSDASLYSCVKQAGDQLVGIHTVCHVLRRGHECLQPMSDTGFLGNLTMKINLKVNFDGVNHTLKTKDPILTDETMILGIDVTHPGSAGMRDAPSVAAVVGSVDAHFAQWPASLRSQLPEDVLNRKGKTKKQSIERVVDLHEMVLERLEAYWSRTKDKMPTQLVVYRDGLSEEQFDMCRARELPAIQSALSQFVTEKQSSNPSIGGVPKILLICAVKRHHTRLYPKDDREDMALFIGRGQNNKGSSFNFNPLPGTLVTDRITTGKGNDFFLISQNALQGTARPTHYHVLHNEMESTLKDIATMTHNLSFIFGRATRSVGVCTPVYYADLAADRARCYVRNVYNAPPDEDTKRRPTYAQGTTPFNLAVHARMSATMFYL